MVFRCATCSAEVAEGMNFCGACGTPILERCSSCGTPAASAEQAFCGECGAHLAGGPAAAPRHPGRPDLPGAERRLVAVLFADLVGYTSFSESHDAEEVRDMLSDYFEMSRGIIEAYGGRVEKFIGDAVMSVWGVPQAQEDDAERAVRAALDLVSAVGALGDQLGLGLKLRVGVVTGEAAVDLRAIHEGMVIGDTVNTASRLQSLAQPETVLVDHVTRTITDRAIVYEDAGAHELKGKAGLVAAWRAMRVVAARGGAGRADAIEPPLIGRDDELALVRAATADVLVPGAGLRLVTVISEAGLGKSRLAWELEKHADGLAANVNWHRGRAVSFGEGGGMRALADVVSMRAGIAQEEPAAQRRDKADALVEDLFSGDPTERERVGRALLPLLGLDSGTSVADSGELFSAWRLLFERLASRAPVVMVLDDLQWADQAQLDFIVHLTDWVRSSPIFVLALSRPDERIERVAALGDRLELAPLTDLQMDTLVEGLVTDAPPLLLERVREHAGGVPLYAVETLRMLIDRGTLIAEGDHYVLTGELSNLAVPPTIHALIASRLDALGTLERQALLNAAVLGERFTAADVGSLTDLAESDARSLLDGLVAKQLLGLDLDPRSPQRGRYSFLQAVVQRVALGTLSRRERKSRHLAAAERLSARERDADVVPALAGHLLAAAEAEPAAADAGNIRSRALSAVLDAAARADAVGASSEAIALFDRAAAMEEDEWKRAGVLERAALTAERSGDARAAAERYSAAGELHHEAGRAREGLRLRARELSALRYTLPPSEILPTARELHGSLADERDAAFAIAAGVLAFTLYQSGEPQEAERLANEAAAAAEQSGAHVELGFALSAWASALSALGRTIPALYIFSSARDVAERHDPRRVGLLTGNMALTLVALGRYEEAIDNARAAVGAAERAADRFTRDWATVVLGRALVSVGAWDEAIAAIDTVRPGATPYEFGMAAGPPLLVALRRGDDAQVGALLDELDRRRDESDASTFEHDFRGLSEVARAHLDGDFDRVAQFISAAELADFSEWPGWLAPAVDLLLLLPSAEALDHALAALREPGAPRRTPPVQVQTQRLAAHLAGRLGDTTRAAAGLMAAERAAQDAGLVFEAAVLALERAELHDTDELDGAIGTFERLHAGPWLTRALTLRAGRSELDSPARRLESAHGHPAGAWPSSQ